MDIFDYSFLEHDKLPAKFVSIVGHIYELREHINEQKRKKNLEKRFTDLEHKAKIQSIKYSNIPESLKFAEERIIEIVNQNAVPVSKDKMECEIAGYRNVLDFICAEHPNLDVCETDIFKISNQLLTYSYSGDKYKKKNLEIMKDGELARFISVQDIIKKIAQVYTEARNNYNINPLLLIPCFTLDFIGICKFSNDNIQMAMLLLRLLLYKNGFDVVRYISFEEQIYRNQSAYIQTINDGLTNWKKRNIDYIPFIEQFITVVLSCYTELFNYFPKATENQISKTQQIINAVYDSAVPISKSEVCKLLPHVSPTTVEYSLGNLMREGKIEKIGNGINTKYIKK